MMLRCARFALAAVAVVRAPRRRRRSCQIVVADDPRHGRERAAVARPDRMFIDFGCYVTRRGQRLVA